MEVERNAAVPWDVRVYGERHRGSVSQNTETDLWVVIVFVDLNDPPNPKAEDLTGRAIMHLAAAWPADADGRVIGLDRPPTEQEVIDLVIACDSGEVEKRNDVYRRQAHGPW